MATILITSMGGAGSNNLTDTIRLINSTEHKVIGTHYDPYELAKGESDVLCLVPMASSEDDYVQTHLQIIEKYNVDLLIANSDKEVAVWSKHREKLTCLHTIPIGEQADLVQDKFRFYETLTRHGCDTVPNIPIESRDGVADAIAKLPSADKFWIRLRGGMGSLGATWLQSVDQALKWIDLWQELRGIEPEEFVLAPFLPGRDFCVSMIWQNGEFSVGKIYERLSYWNEATSLSAMGSSPLSARTVAETAPVENAKAAVLAVHKEFGSLPHGFYQCDLKCDDEGRCYVTEINLGRFPQTSTHFDRVGKYKLLELYLSLLLTPEVDLPRDEYDLDPGILILRGPDMKVKLVPESVVEDLKKHQI
jgi:hypothetical protein